jgi:hypothetical protein
MSPQEPDARVLKLRFLVFMVFEPDELILPAQAKGLGITPCSDFGPERSVHLLPIGD